MSSNEQLLVCVHKNAEMGKNSIEKLMSVSEDKAFNESLERDLEQYKRIWLSSDTLLKASDGDDSGVPVTTKVMSDMMVDFTALTDNSTEKLSEMLLKGVEKGLNELDQTLGGSGKHADEETKNLAHALRSFMYAERSRLLS